MLRSRPKIWSGERRIAAAGRDAPDAGSAPARRAGRSRLAIAATLAAGVAGGVLAALLVMAVVGTQFMGYRLLTVQSGSMAPAFERGDLVLVRPTRPVSLKGGDAVVFRAAGDALVLHRIVSVTRVDLSVTDTQSGDVSRTTRLQFRTKGDASLALDAMAVDGTAVVGEPWFRIPGAGGVGVFSLRGALFAVAALTALGWLAWEIRGRSGRWQPSGGESR